MRLRNIQGAEETIQESNYVIKTPYDYKNKWNSYFGNNQPLHIEIGMGKGKFIIESAKKNPEINYIGVEKFSSVLVRAIPKIEEERLNNLFVIRMDAISLPELFAKDEVDKIYLNFSDPWPKDRHAKRRLTSKEFLALYDAILSPNGLVEFKTDNKCLFEFSLEQIPIANWVILDYTKDLHHSKLKEGNILTEYEEKFSSQGKLIYKLITKRG